MTLRKTRNIRFDQQYEYKRVTTSLHIYPKLIWILDHFNAWELRYFNKIERFFFYSHLFSTDPCKLKYISSINETLCDLASLYPIWPNLMRGIFLCFFFQRQISNTGLNAQLNFACALICSNSAKVNSKQSSINNIIIIN